MGWILLLIEFGVVFKRNIYFFFVVCYCRSEINGRWSDSDKRVFCRFVVRVEFRGTWEG